MAQEKSAGAIIFRREKDDIKFLLLHYKLTTDYWDFPRGNIEKDETEQITAAREIEEETGITNITFIHDFMEKAQWFYRRNGEITHKEVTIFLAETSQEQITLSKEHIGYAWLSYPNAMKKLSFKNAKEILEKAQTILR